MRKADGSYTYFVPDVAYHLAKFGARLQPSSKYPGLRSPRHGRSRPRWHSSRFRRLPGFNIPKTFPEYMLHKMLQVVKDGQPVKMSKRSGNLRHALWTWSTGSEKDAARLFMVNRRADAEFVFDVDLALSRPTKTRSTICSTPMPESALFLPRRRKKALGSPLSKKWLLKTCLLLTAPTELRLMSKLFDFPDGFGKRY